MTGVEITEVVACGEREVVRDNAGGDGDGDGDDAVVVQTNKVVSGISIALLVVEVLQLETEKLSVELKAIVTDGTVELLSIRDTIIENVDDTTGGVELTAAALMPVRELAEAPTVVEPAISVIENESSLIVIPLPLPTNYKYIQYQIDSKMDTVLQLTCSITSRKQNQHKWDQH